MIRLFVSGTESDYENYAKFISTEQALVEETGDKDFRVIVASIAAQIANTTPDTVQ